MTFKNKQLLHLIVLNFFVNCSLNGLTTLATRVKLDQLLKMAEDNNVQVIAIRETKLKLKTTLKYKGFNIYRKDRPTREGGGLAFFIQGLSYQSIDTTLVENSDLEIQGIKISWRGKPLRIFNVYHPPNQKQLPDFFPNLMDKDTIILGDLNVKHSSWGYSNDNNRWLDILQYADDNDFMILNDGMSTYIHGHYHD